jgi:hypothetical protein
MKRRLCTVIDDLAPMLFEANVVLGIQNRAADIGFTVDRSFVRARLDRWQDAIAGVEANREKLSPRASGKRAAL